MLNGLHHRHASNYKQTMFLYIYTHYPIGISYIPQRRSYIFQSICSFYTLPIQCTSHFFEQVLIFCGQVCVKLYRKNGHFWYWYIFNLTRQQDVHVDTDSRIKLKSTKLGLTVLYPYQAHNIHQF
jgi:hypothetical protein